MSSFYKNIPYFKATTVDGSRVVTGNLVNDKYNAIICTSGYFIDECKEGYETFMLEHTYEVDPSTIEVITFDELLKGIV